MFIGKLYLLELFIKAFKFVPDPEIKIQDLKKIKLTKYVAKVDDKDFEKTLDTFTKTQQTFEYKDGKKAENGAAILLNLNPTFNGQIVKEALLEKKLTILGNKMIIPEIEKKLIGTKEGDKLDFVCKFPKNFPNKDIAEKDVNVKIDVLEVRIAKQKPLDDDFGKSMGAKDLNDFKDKVRKQMQEELNNVAKINLKKVVLDDLDKMDKPKLPEGLVNNEFENIWKKFLDDKSKGIIDKSDQNKKEEEVKKEYLSISGRRVKLGLVLAKIGEDNKIDVSEDDIKKAIEMEILRQPAAKDQIINFYTKNAEAVASLKAPIFEEKVVDHILGNVSVVEKVVSREELYKK